MRDSSSTGNPEKSALGAGISRVTSARSGSSGSGRAARAYPPFTVLGPGFRSLTRAGHSPCPGARRGLFCTTSPTRGSTPFGHRLQVVARCCPLLPRLISVLWRSGDEAVGSLRPPDRPQGSRQDALPPRIAAPSHHSQGRRPPHAAYYYSLLQWGDSNLMPTGEAGLSSALRTDTHPPLPSPIDNPICPSIVRQLPYLTSAPTVQGCPRGTPATVLTGTGGNSEGRSTPQPLYREVSATSPYSRTLSPRKSHR